MMREADQNRVSRNIAGAAVLSLFIQFLPSQASAWNYPLTDGNSSLAVNPDGPHYGINNWTVDGTSNLYLQWFWYRIGSTGGESAINALPIVSVNQTGNNTLNVVYANSQLNISAQFNLVGGASGSGSSTLNEQLKVTNLTGQTLDFHFFQYTDFDLGGSYQNDTVQLFTDLQGKFVQAFQSSSGVYFSDTLVSPGADRGQAGVSSEALLDALKDSNPTTLNNNSGPVSGDAIWALQWDRTLGSSNEFTVDITKNLYVTSVPEPSSAALLGIGLAAFSLIKRRSGKSDGQS